MIIVLIILVLILIILILKSNSRKLVKRKSNHSKPKKVKDTIFIKLEKDIDPLINFIFNEESPIKERLLSEISKLKREFKDNEDYLKLLKFKEKSSYSKGIIKLTKRKNKVIIIYLRKIKKELVKTSFEKQKETELDITNIKILLNLK